MLVHLWVYKNLVISVTGDARKKAISGPHGAEPKSASSFQVARSWTTRKSSLTQRMKAALCDILFLSPAPHAQTLPCLSAMLEMKLGPCHAKKRLSNMTSTAGEYRNIISFLTEREDSLKWAKHYIKSSFLTPALPKAFHTDQFCTEP